MLRIEIDRRSWDAGFAAGEQGKAAIMPGCGCSTCQSLRATCPSGYDAYSWHSGYIEGDAKRQGYSYVNRLQ